MVGTTENPPDSGTGVESSLRSALQKLARCQDKAGGKLDAATDALDRALVEYTDGVSELEVAAESIDMDPSQLEQVEDRLFALRALARKHGVEVAGLPALRHQFEAIQIVPLFSSISFVNHNF